MYRKSYLSSRLTTSRSVLTGPPSDSLVEAPATHSRRIDRESRGMGYERYNSSVLFSAIMIGADNSPKVQSFSEEKTASGCARFMTREEAGDHLSIKLLLFGGQIRVSRRRDIIGRCFPPHESCRFVVGYEGHS